MRPTCEHLDIICVGIPKILPRIIVVSHNLDTEGQSDTAMPLLYQIIILLLIARRSSCYSHFRTKSGKVRPIITECIAKPANISDSTQCYAVLNCILDNVTIGFLARWSAGASILAFIPTVVR